MSMLAQWTRERFAPLAGASVDSRAQDHAVAGGRVIAVEARTNAGKPSRPKILGERGQPAFHGLRAKPVETRGRLAEARVE